MSRLVVAVRPGLVDTEASRPWFNDSAHAQRPREAAEAVIELAFVPAPRSFVVSSCSTAG